MYAYGETIQNLLGALENLYDQKIKKCLPRAVNTAIDGRKNIDQQGQF